MARWANRNFCHNFSHFSFLRCFFFSNRPSCVANQSINPSNIRRCRNHGTNRTSEPKRFRLSSVSCSHYCNKSCITIIPQNTGSCIISAVGHLANNIDEDCRTSGEWAWHFDLKIGNDPSLCPQFTDACTEYYNFTGTETVDKLVHLFGSTVQPVDPTGRFRSIQPVDPIDSIQLLIQPVYPTGRSNRSIQPVDPIGRSDPIQLVDPTGRSNWSIQPVDPVVDPTGRSNRSIKPVDPDVDPTGRSNRSIQPVDPTPTGRSNRSIQPVGPIGRFRSIQPVDPTGRSNRSIQPSIQPVDPTGRSNRSIQPVGPMHGFQNKIKYYVNIGILQRLRLYDNGAIWALWLFLMSFQI